jgi:hypothetical protein
MHSLIATAWPDPLRIRVNELRPRSRSWSEKSCTVFWGREWAFGKRVVAIGWEWLLLVQSKAGLRSKAFDWPGFCEILVCLPN